MMAFSTADWPSSWRRREKEMKSRLFNDLRRTGKVRPLLNPIAPVVILGLAAVLGILLACAPAGALTLITSGDTFTYSGSVNTNYNGSGLLVKQWGTGYTRYVWLKFNIPSTDVKWATLKMACTEGSGGWTVRVGWLEYNFNETTLTWSNQPTSGFTNLTDWALPSNPVGTYTADITSVWNSNKNKTISLRLRGQTDVDKAVYFQDKELSRSGSTLKPQIEYCPQVYAGPVSPSSVTVCPGTQVTFSLPDAYGGDPNLNYHWWWNDSQQVGTGATHTTSTPGKYTCLVTNSCDPYGVVQTSPGYLYNYSAFSAGNITGGGGTICSGGDPGAMTANPSGGAGSYSYQWHYKDGTTAPSSGGTLISGATAKTYDPPSGLTVTRSYQCRVTDTCGTAWTTNYVTVTITPSPSISSHPVSQTKCAGETAIFSVTASNATSYKWQKNSIDIGGATNSSYTTPTLVAGDDGNHYRCVVSNSCGSVTSNAAVLTVNTAPSITAQPSGDSVFEGAGVTFSVTATGTDPISYQWRKGGSDIIGAESPSHSISSAVIADSGSYDCVVTNACGSATSDAAALTVSALPIGEAKKRADASDVILSGKTVTAVFADHFYMQDDSTSGIRVAPATMPAGLTVGYSVDVVGILATTSNMERVVVPTSVDVSSGSALAPVSLTNKNLGGGDFFYDPGTGAGQTGVEDGVGVNNIGLLVKTCGTVTAVGATYFYIDDGTHARDFSIFNGIRVSCIGLTMPSSGDYICISGISSIMKVNGRVFRSVMPRNDDDLQLMNP
jgi:hypothetical protein